MFHRATSSFLPGARFALFGAALLSGAISTAQAASEEAGSERHGPPRRPPEQAFDACSDRAEGDACSFEVHERTLDGTCRPAPPNGDDDGTTAKLACMPEPPAPPPEAVSACANLSAGDACTVQFDDRSVQGVCSAKQDGALFCRPEHPPRD